MIHGYAVHQVESLQVAPFSSLVRTGEGFQDGSARPMAQAGLVTIPLWRLLLTRGAKTR